MQFFNCPRLVGFSRVNQLAERHQVNVGGLHFLQRGIFGQRCLHMLPLPQQPPERATDHAEQTAQQQQVFQQHFSAQTHEITGLGKRIAAL